MIHLVEKKKKSLNPKYYTTAALESRYENDNVVNQAPLGVPTALEWKWWEKRGTSEGLEPLEADRGFVRASGVGCRLGLG